MPIGRWTVRFSRLFFVLFLSHGALGIACATEPAPPPVVIRHHDLFVQIVPEQHGLIAKDRLTVEMSQPKTPIRFSLASTLQIDRITLVQEAIGADSLIHDLPFEVRRGSSPESTLEVSIPSQAENIGLVTLDVEYHGAINDPPRDPRHLRFVTPSETAGHIGPEGVYVSSESHWYPDVPESLSTYRLLVAMPEGWTTVTQGTAGESRACPAGLCRNNKLMTTEWTVAQQSEALTLVANTFVTSFRDWTAKTGQKIRLLTYLFPDDAHLAEEYLDATARYLDTYIPLLGPYPFEKFAVVENFFASGLGMPSFTLLGSGVIKRHYVQPYALGHEIVHSWIGNSVFNRAERGNWVEGLTTYLANYYWYELIGDRAQARDQRRLMVQGYNLHVPPERDYPVAQFTQKQDEHDNAIGYQKSAMLFHLLRQEVGDETFWRALMSLVVRYRGKHAEWRDLERVFTEESRQNLRWFFAQWVEQDGAPVLSLSESVARQVVEGSTQTFRLKTTIVQSSRPFRLSLQLLIRMEDGREQKLTVPLRSLHEAISVTLPARPVTIELDPEFMTFRRIARQSMPPVLNHFVTDRQRSVLMAFTDEPGHPSPFRDVVARIEAQEQQKPIGERAVVGSMALDGLLPQEGSVLILGSSELRSGIRSILANHCGNRVTLSDRGVAVMGVDHEGPELALLVSCHRIDHPGSVVTVLYAVTPEAVTKVARLLFFYGWNSFVLFRDGAVAARGEWPLESDRTEVRLNVESFIR
ncbi:MAG TPA: M1 family aminopeptidase [Nitrospiraceae bacterium]|nr:M1 family aminopeptidase [Nitrospiraceae bacterium]